VRGSPQLEVAEAIVQFVAVLMMDLLVGQQRPAECFSHDEPMLSYVVLVIGEVPILAWYGYETISASYCALPFNLTNRDIGSWIPGRHYPLVVGGAIPAGLPSSVTSFDDAHLFSFPKWGFVGLPVSLQTLIVAVAVAVGVVRRMAVFDDANTAHLERSWRAGVTRPENASIMHFAVVAPPVERPLASFDLAVRLHSAEGTAPVGQ
jgi:hypothetical protein